MYLYTHIFFSQSCNRTSSAGRWVIRFFLSTLKRISQTTYEVYVMVRARDIQVKWLRFACIELVLVQLWCQLFCTVLFGHPLVSLVLKRVLRSLLLKSFDRSYIIVYVWHCEGSKCKLTILDILVIPKVIITISRLRLLCNWNWNIRNFIHKNRNFIASFRTSFHLNIIGRQS